MSLGELRIKRFARYTYRVWRRCTLQNERELWTEEEQGYWLAFDRLSGAGLGLQKIKQLFERFHSLKPVWHANREMLKQFAWFTPEMIETFIKKRETIDPEALLKIVARAEVKAFPYFHPGYPFRLREIHDPPLIIYMRGDLHPDQIPHAVGIVGTRRPTSYGQRLAKQISRELARNGVAVISGMAIGIDSLAHWGAIEGGGKTVAVLGCGPDVCYPSSNKPLFRALGEGNHGAIISEFFPGTKPDTWRFPARNRIISGISQALLVVEAGETSGSLITARLAFEQNREVFAIPGRVDNPASKGTNSLIARNMAHLISGSEDIMKEMNWVPSSPVREIPTVVELYGRERELYDLLSAEPVHFDVLCERSGMSAPELSATLTMLELAGVVERHPGDWYSRGHSVATTR